MLFDDDKSKNSKIRKFLSQIYGEKQYKSDFSKLDDTGIIQQAQNLSRGIPMATPVFDGANETDVREILN